LIRGLALAASLGVLGVAVAATPAHAQSTPEVLGPWDGTNPFKCQLQDVGTGTDYPDPAADPFCVEFDKTSQNVTDLGLVDFLSKESARVAAASTKCFYFQRDHWTGSVIQGQDPELWHWDGSYFFDLGKGIGGVHVANLRVGGVPLDATPYAPAALRPFLVRGGGGGAMLELETRPHPACAARVDTAEERRQIYRDEPLFPNCVEPGGELRGRRLGALRLGMDREGALSRLGPPRSHARRTDRWCVEGDASLWATYGRGGTPRVAMIRTTSRGHTERRVGAGTRRAKARRKLGLERRFSLGATDVFEARRRWRSPTPSGSPAPRPAGLFAAERSAGGF
jgi:hypothetical protein